MPVGRQIYFGIVEDNADPRRMGRCRIRVQTVFDQIPVGDIPWATPHRACDGRSFSVPAVGKIVNVLFENGDLYSPVYMYSENYNINLENKLKDLSDEAYLDFVALIFDHNSQVYADDESLVLDYHFNRIKIHDGGVDVSLKNTQQKINLGDEGADEEAVLGTAFFDWFTQFIDALVKPTALVGNYGSPVLKPEIDSLCAQYKAKLQDFKSKYVFLLNNGNVSKPNEKARPLSTEKITEDRDLTVLSYNDPELAPIPAKTSSEVGTEAKESIQQNNDRAKTMIEDSLGPQDGDDNDTLSKAGHRTQNIYDARGKITHTIDLDTSEAWSSGTSVVVRDTSGNIEDIILTFSSSSDAKTALDKLNEAFIVGNNEGFGPETTTQTT